MTIRTPLRRRLAAVALIILALLPVTALAGDGEPLYAPKSAEKAARKKIVAAMNAYRKTVHQVTPTVLAALKQLIADGEDYEAFVEAVQPTILGLETEWDGVSQVIEECSATLYADIDEGQVLTGFEGSGGCLANQVYARMDQALGDESVRVTRALGRMQKKADKACLPIVPVVGFAHVRGDRIQGQSFFIDSLKPVQGAITVVTPTEVRGWLRNLPDTGLPIMRIEDGSFNGIELTVMYLGGGEFKAELPPLDGPTTISFGAIESECATVRLVDQVQIAPRSFVAPGPGAPKCSSLSEGEASGSGNVVFDGTLHPFTVQAGDALLQEGELVGISTSVMQIQDAGPSSATILITFYDPNGLEKGTYPMPAEPASKAAEIVVSIASGTYYGTYGSGSVTVQSLSKGGPSGVTSVVLDFSATLGDSLGGELEVSGNMQGCFANFTP